LGWEGFEEEENFGGGYGGSVRGVYDRAGGGGILMHQCCQPLDIELGSATVATIG